MKNGESLLVHLKKSLKAVLLHNSNKYASIPVGYSMFMKESYKNLVFFLRQDQLQRSQLNHLKGFEDCMLLEQQPGYTKFPCFLCERDSRARNVHWTQERWPSSDSFT